MFESSGCFVLIWKYFKKNKTKKRSFPWRQICKKFFPDGKFVFTHYSKICRQGKMKFAVREIVKLHVKITIIQSRIKNCIKIHFEFRKTIHYSLSKVEKIELIVTISFFFQKKIFSIFKFFFNFLSFFFHYKMNKFKVWIYFLWILKFLYL